jgi:hypothetical protein
MENEWLPQVVPTPEPKRLSDAITRGFDKARGHGGGREGRLAGTLLNGSTSTGDDVRQVTGSKKKLRIEVSWVESRAMTHLREVDLRPVKSSMRGYLLRETKSALIVASSIADGQARGAIVSIPKRSITKRIDG